MEILERWIVYIDAWGATKKREEESASVKLGMPLVRAL